jgi:hypothetical protein
MNTLARAFLALLVFVFAQPGAASSRWELMNERDGIATYGVPADADGFVSFKGVAVLDAVVADVATVMADNSTAADWMPMVAERRDLRVVSATLGSSTCT